MSNIEKHRAFINSLEGEKGLQEKIRRFRLIKLGDDKKLHRSDEGEWVRYQDHLDAIDILESRQIPDLKEKVKEFGWDAMNAADENAQAEETSGWSEEIEMAVEKYRAFRSICAPDRGGEVKP